MKKTLNRAATSMLAVLLFLSIVLSACSSPSPVATKASDAQSQPTQANTSGAVGWDKNKKDKVVLSVINNYYTAGEKQLAVDYMKLHPETEVVVDVVASNDAYTAKMKTTITTDINTAPDIVHGNFANSVAGGWALSYEKGYLMDLMPILDEVNPYNDGKKVREAFRDQDITLAISNAEGKLGFMPFDWVGVGVFYNKTVFDKLGLKPPTSMEEWLTLSQKLKEAGYEAPIAASFVSQWLLSIYGDIAYRPMEDQFLTLPGDAMYDENTMKGNVTIKYNATDPTFDTYAVFNREKLLAYAKKNSINTAVNKQIWKTFADLGKYFQKNWTNPDDAKVLADFETQQSPVMLHGSWNVGKIVDDMAKLPKDKQFAWGTFRIPGYANPPSGFDAQIRSLYVYGNDMSIIPKSNADHMARVIDVYKYWMTPKVAQMMYEVTLASGNYIQGPPAILGVTLSPENNLRLTGFVSEGNMKQEFGVVVGQTQYLAEDQSIYNDINNKLTDGKISLDDFMTQLNELSMKAIDDAIAKGGYDLDPKTKDTPKQ
jgi:raffinose/stachyose/melibiose transport system substrate-binding protein